MEGHEQVAHLFPSCGRDQKEPGNAEQQKSTIGARVSGIIDLCHASTQELRPEGMKNVNGESTPIQVCLALRPHMCRTGLVREVERRVQQLDMRKGLREITQLTFIPPIVLF